MYRQPWVEMNGCDEIAVTPFLRYADVSTSYVIFNSETFNSTLVSQ